MKLNRYYLFLMAGAVFFASAHAFVVQAQTLPRGERLRQIIEERRASGQPMLQNVAQAKVFFRRLFSLQKEALGNIRQKISSREKLPAEIKAQLLALFDARIAEVEGQAKELEAITSVQALPLFVQGLKTSRDTFRTEVRSILSPYLSSKGFRLIDELKEREALLKEKLTELKRRGVDTSRIEERLVRANDHLKRAEELLRGGSFADNGSNVSALAQGIGSGGRVWRYAAAVFKEMASALGKATREFKSVLALINGEIIGSAQAALLTATLTLTIKPSITDPAIGDANGDHMVFLPSVFPQQGKLFVFFPGTGGMPKHTTYINQTAASVGYHAIDLAYINDLSAKQGCARSPNPNCKENMRMEIITGTDTSPVVDVNRANSIENRLIKLLEYLIRTRPAAEGWGAFVSSSNVRWDLVVAAGHSQGAGHAAMLGKTRLLDRAVMFAGTEPAAWTTEPFITPAERFYGFVHTADPLSYPESVTSWQNIGLPGTETSVDNATPPFNNAHKLLTSSRRSECWGGNAHGCILTDPKTPLDAKGVPIFQDVWKYLIVSAASPTSDKKIFLSSVTYTGSLGGLAGADEKCQTLAQNAGLPGTFKAWLSDSVTAAKDRLTHAIAPYKRVDGATVASNWDDIVDGALTNPIYLTETGTLMGAGTSVWTNTDQDGSIHDPLLNWHCANWTSNVASFKGHWGLSDGSDNYLWTNFNMTPATCDLQKRLYCVEQ